MKLIAILVLWGLFMTATGPNWMTVCVGILVLCSLQDAKPAPKMPPTPVKEGWISKWLDGPRDRRFAAALAESKKQLAARTPDQVRSDYFFSQRITLNPPREARRGQA